MGNVGLHVVERVLRRCSDRRPLERGTSCLQVLHLSMMPKRALIEFTNSHRRWLLSRG